MGRRVLIPLLLVALTGTLGASCFRRQQPPAAEPPLTAWQQVLARRPPGSQAFLTARHDTSGAVGTGGTLRDGTRAAGEHTGAAARFTVDVGGARRFYVADWLGTTTACDQPFSVNLVDVSQGNFPCTGGHVLFEVPDPGRNYELEIASTSGGTGRYSFRIVTVKPGLARTLQIGQHVSGQIGTAGVVDRYEFAAGGAGTIKVTEVPLECGGMWYAVRDTQGNHVVGTRPLCGFPAAIHLPDTQGRYVIEISAGPLGTGPYTFRLEAG